MAKSLWLSMFDTLSPNTWEQIAAYLQHELVDDLENGDRQLAIAVLKWVSLHLDPKSPLPVFLKPEKKPHRPRGSGAHWYDVGQAVDEEIEKLLPNFAAATETERKRARGKAIREVAKARNCDPRTVRRLFDMHKAVEADLTQMRAREAAKSNEEKSSS